MAHMLSLRKMVKEIAIVVLIGVLAMLVAFIGGVLTFDSQPDWAVDGHASQEIGYRFSEP